MSRLIKVIDNETIEIADYRNPEAIFKSSQNPPTLQNTRDEIENLEWYCTFKDTINPFQLYEENKILNNIINELNYGIKELDNMFYETFRISQNGYYSISEWELKEFTDKLQELKGSDKE